MLVISTGCSLYSQPSSEYNSTLKKMFEVSGSEDVYKTVIKQVIGMFKQNKNVPEEIWVSLEKEFLLTSLNDMVEMLTPVYEKHLNQTDLEKLIEFYQSPVGKKFADKTPLIMQESMQVGQQWGMKIGQDFQIKLKEKGY